MSDDQLTCSMGANTRLCCCVHGNLLCMKHCNDVILAIDGLQTRLEEYLTLADSLPEDLVETIEKGKEKDRRQVTREEKILQQKEEHVSFPLVAILHDAACSHASNRLLWSCCVAVGLLTAPCTGANSG